MFPIDVSFLFLLTTFSGLLTLVGWLILRSPQERILLTCGVLSIYLYSGVGLSLPDVPDEYAVYYGLFLLVFVFAFIAGARSIRTRLEFVGIQVSVEKNVDLLKRFAVVYLLMSLVPLLFPEFRLQRLISPPLPDVRTLFFARVEGSVDSGLLGALTQFKIIFFPVFLIGLSQFQRKWFAIPLGLSLLLYIQYCSNAYIGRYEIVQYAALSLITLYLQKQISARFVYLFSGAFTLMFILFYGFYTQIRLGVPVATALGQSFSIGNALADFASSEFSYPRFFSTMLAGGQQVDLWQYLAWIVTLPIPKALIGRGFSLYLNHDISLYLFGIPVGEGGAAVFLVSVLGESVFIYGQDFFWVHALTLGLVFGVLCSLLRSTSALQSTFAYVSSLVLLLGRGGVSSVLPSVIQGLLVIYLWMVLSRKAGVNALPVPETSSRTSGQSSQG